MVTLQGNLNKEPLRLVTLETWHTFLSVLRFKDIVPHVGPSTAAFVTAWDSFSPAERTLAAEIIRYCVVENAQFTGPVLDDIVNLDKIEELKEAAAKLREKRKDWHDIDYIRNVIRRAADENVTISIRALEELRALLLKRDQITQLASGDAFDPVVGELVGILVQSAARDGDNVTDLRDVSLDCLGIIGALDPDRFSLRAEDASMTIKDNLDSLEEAQAFAVHLLVDLIVGAFKATNDTRYQENLAYAIQELSRFCGFTKDLIDKSGAKGGPVGVKTRERWQRIPAQKQVTIGDMLDTKYVLRPVPEKTYERPIYASCPTYREWIQKWTSDLIPRTSEGHARQIFDVFRVVIKSSDVHIARHLLPHLVLNVLLSGDGEARADISAEMRAVLVDQVDPQGTFPADRRLLSAQVHPIAGIPSLPVDLH
jgi:serine/threonine-protein kinase ATR